MAKSVIARIIHCTRLILAESIPNKRFLGRALPVIFLPYVLIDGLDVASRVFQAFAEGLAQWFTLL